MKLFIPEIAYFNPKSLNYEEGKRLKQYLSELNVPIRISNKVLIGGKTPAESFAKAKRTVYITTNNIKELQSCKPSADYQFSLSSSCPGFCEYCYLQSTQGKNPYIKIFVNIDEIIEIIKTHIERRSPALTTFECGSITDPIALEHLTGSVKKIIEFFGESEYGRLRIVTKYDNVDSLLNIKHNMHTKFRFSVNSSYVIDKFEHNTSTFSERIRALSKIAHAGYPLGFIIAPIMIYDGWKEDYEKLIKALKSELIDYKEGVTFELIQHRFTLAAKELIIERYPNTRLDLNEENRQLKWGPYGKYKYVYPKEKGIEIKEYLSNIIFHYFDNCQIEYFT